MRPSKLDPAKDHVININQKYNQSVGIYSCFSVRSQGLISYNMKKITRQVNIILNSGKKKKKPVTFAYSVIGFC